jgi:hypothetical protein
MSVGNVGVLSNFLDNLAEMIKGAAENVDFTNQKTALGSQQAVWKFAVRMEQQPWQNQILQMGDDWSLDIFA